VLEKLRAALNRAIEDPDVQQQMKAIDLTPAWISRRAINESGIPFAAFDASIANVLVAEQYEMVEIIDRASALCYPLRDYGGLGTLTDPYWNRFQHHNLEIPCGIDALE